MINRGPLSKDELIELWKSVTDRSYWEPLLNDPESKIIVEALAEMFARASESVNTNSQSLYVRHHSSETASPATGARWATTTLEVSRQRLFHTPLTIRTGVVFEQWVDDWGPDGPIPVSTGRRYLATQDCTLAPGDPGPLLVPVIAELPGFGYNLPAPGTISRVLQVATPANTGATIIPGLVTNEMQVPRIPDVPSINTIGSYVRFTAGANLGDIRLITGFVAANSNGGISILLGAIGTFETSTPSGDWLVGEDITQASTGATGRVMAWTPSHVVVQVTGGVFDTSAITGEFGVTATIQEIEVAPAMIPETSTASWEVVSWEVAFGLLVTNTEYPTGGRSAMLDEIGEERGIARGVNETDESYRPRVGTPADTVSPDAVRRAANRILKPLGLSICLREVGEELFPGFFYDHDHYDYGRVVFTVSGSLAGFKPGEVVQQNNGGNYTKGRISISRQVSGALVFNGVDGVEGPGFINGGTLQGVESGATVTITSTPGGSPNEKRFNLLLSRFESRAFFLIGLPEFAQGIDGLFYDASLATNFFDANLPTNFYDGIPPTSQQIYAQVYSAVDAARASGVSFDMYVERIGCF